MRAGIASLNLNEFFNVYRSKCMWISEWHGLNILKDDFIPTTFFLLKLYYSFKYNLLLLKNEMIGDWLLVKYISVYKLDILVPKKFITPSTGGLLCHCFSFKYMCPRYCEE